MLWQTGYSVSIYTTYDRGWFHYQFWYRRLRTNFCDIRLPLLCFLDLVVSNWKININGVENTKISNWSVRITFTKHICKLSESTVRKLYCARLKVNKFKYTVGDVLSNHPCVNKFVRAVPAHTTKHYASVCEPSIITRFPSFPLKCAP